MKARKSLIIEASDSLLLEEPSKEYSQSLTKMPFDSCLSQSESESALSKSNFRCRNRNIARPTCNSLQSSKFNRANS